MGGVCGFYGAQQKCITGFWWETLKRRETGRTRIRWQKNIKMDLKFCRPDSWFSLGESRTILQTCH